MFCPGCCCTSAVRSVGIATTWCYWTTSCRTSRRNWSASGHLHDKIHVGLDYFDASINRVAAWVIGARNMVKALLIALLETHEHPQASRTGRGLHAPAGDARRAEEPAVDGRLGLLLRETGVPVGGAWFDEVTSYEKQVLSKR